MEREEWLDEEFTKNQADEGDIMGLLQWKLAKRASGSKKKKRQRANKQKKEEEAAAAAHQQAMADVENAQNDELDPVEAAEVAAVTQALES